MTDSFVTQCPHCQTRFRVSYNQLGAARGAVRCGACKQVFNAARQLLEQSAAEQAQAAVAAPAPTEAPAPGVAPAALAEAPTWQPTEPTHAPRAPMSLREWQAAQLDAMDLDSELARLERRAPAQASGTTHALSASRDSHDEHWPDEHFGDHTGAEHGATEAIAAEEADEPAYAEPTEAQREEPRLAPSDPLEDLDAPLRPAPRERRQALHTEPEHGPADDDDEATAAPRAGRATSRERTEPNLRDSHLLDLEDDPLQLQWQRSRSSAGKRVLWGLLSLLAALALLGQYCYYNFEQLARQDQYRPWFQALCPVVGCTLPSKVAVGLIKSSNLVVRSHPDFAGALVVDAIIYNRAGFSQPFPMLELRFADVNGQLIASRRFKPAEYLGGDLAGQTEMPPQTPIHIALDILDPGPRAVNYSLSFRSPE
ncbi:DUF3426 domain-containing protein [Pseudomonas sp. NPDC007930]|uniref:DUF3426 domain-containing protein n=1 Tax=Pseudomonas sp. NPDC007930 TaxID=3364417 RepID=UPI0036F0D01B